MQLPFFTKRVLRKGSIGKLHFTVLLCALQKELCSGTLCDTAAANISISKTKTCYLLYAFFCQNDYSKQVCALPLRHLKVIKNPFQIKNKCSFPCLLLLLAFIPQSLLLVPTVPNMGTRSQFTKLICIIIYESETLAVHSVI